MGMRNVAAATIAGQALVRERQWAAHAVFVLMANISLDKVNEDGQEPRQVFMKQADIAEFLWGEWTPYREKQVKTAVETLRAAGLLRVLKRGGNGRTARYELLFEPGEIVLAAAEYAAQKAAKKPRIAAATAKAKATRAAKHAAQAADEALLAEVAAVVDTASVPEVGGYSMVPVAVLVAEVGGDSVTPSGGDSVTPSGGHSVAKLGVTQSPPLRGRGKRRSRRREEEAESPEVSTSPAAVDEHDDDAELAAAKIELERLPVGRYEALLARARADGHTSTRDVMLSAAARIADAEGSAPKVSA
jgi:hypothetical protein